MSELLNWAITMKPRILRENEKFMYLKVQVFAVDKDDAIIKTRERMFEMGVDNQKWDFLESQIIFTPDDFRQKSHRLPTIQRR